MEWMNLSETKTKNEVLYLRKQYYLCRDINWNSFQDTVFTAENFIDRLGFKNQLFFCEIFSKVLAHDIFLFDTSST